MGNLVKVSLPSEMVDALRNRVERWDFSSLDDAVTAAIEDFLQAEDDARGLESIRARIRRSLDDPTPSLTRAEVQQHLDALYARHQR